MRTASLALLLTVAGCSGVSSPGPASSETPTNTAAVPTSATPATSEIPGTTVPLPTGPAVASSSTTEPSEAVEVSIRIESRADDVSFEDFETVVMMTLLDERGWSSADFRFSEDENAAFRVILAEPAEVDRLCAPFRTNGRVSCQNGPVVAINADRWRTGVPHWNLGLDTYRRYLVNHEVGHLIGMRHPEPRCPQAGQPAAVMSQQTHALEGCLANVWPRQWELDLARLRPATLAPDHDWAPGPPPRNEGT